VSEFGRRTGYDPAHISRIECGKRPGSRVDRKDLFYAEVKARNGIPASEARLHEEIATLKARNEALRQERDDYRTATETCARAIAHR
jgi:hypothetical protein